jgi:hypothetical protein
MLLLKYLSNTNWMTLMDGTTKRLQLPNFICIFCLISEHFLHEILILQRVAASKAFPKTNQSPIY